MQNTRGGRNESVPLRLIFTLAVAGWFGMLLCLSFVVTPAAHRSLSRGEARQFLRPIFQRIYRAGTVLGFVALLTMFLARDSLSAGELARMAFPVGVAVLASLVGGEVLFPRLRGLDGEDPRFSRLHQISAMLNTASIAALVLALAGAVAR